MKQLQNTLNAGWNVQKGDYLSPEDDYAQRHETVIKKEAVRKRALRITMGVLTAGYVFYVFHIIAKI